MRAQATWLITAAAALAAGCLAAPDERASGAVGPEDPTLLPQLTDDVVYDNGVCTFQDTVPYVRDVRWDEPRVHAAMRALGPGYRSEIGYGEWRIVYGLESESSNDYLVRKAATARNFIRVLCGENRDDQRTFDRKLLLLANADPDYRAAQGLPAIPRQDEPALVYARAGEMQEVDVEGNLFSQITWAAYERMLVIMRGVHAYRQSQRRGLKDGYHYGFRDKLHHSYRVDRSVEPWTHCEMKFMFEQYLGPDSPVSSANWGGLQCDLACAAAYVQAYAEYQEASCAPEDFETMYDFRGHKVFQPQWLDSNGFLWESQRAGAVDNRTRRQAGDPAYYLHPFASRYERTRRGLATFFLYPEAQARKLMTASEVGGGPIMYVTDQDANGDHLADFLLFNKNGCGDPGPVPEDPASNCNMVSWVTAAATTPETRHAVAWHPESFEDPDMGFLAAFPTFDARMTRFNQALDRHSNWGPTGYYLPGMHTQTIQGGQVVADRPGFLSSYSPFVATSYDVSASDAFARKDYTSTHPLEQGKTKWMFIIRFRASDYYDEADLAAGNPIDFDRQYFNETSLSNDYYRERSLDRFGWIDADDIYASIYFVYANRGDEPEAIVDLPMPDAAPAQP